VTKPDLTAQTVDEKLCELMLYIAQKSQDDKFFGAVKLNKLLYYADVEAYRRLGKSITGTDYKHRREGPVPPSDRARRRLVQRGRAKVDYKPTEKRDQERLIPKSAPNTSLFSNAELGIIDETIRKYWQFTGTALSKKSHEEFGYKLTREGETIPLRTAWLSSARPTKAQIEVGQKIAKKHGLAV